jgi:hypothetical protein
MQPQKNSKRILSVGDWVTQKVKRYCTEFWANLNIECKNESAADLYHLMLMGKECDWQLKLDWEQKPFEVKLLALWILNKTIDAKSIYLRSSSPDAFWNMSSDHLAVAFSDDLALVPTNLKEFAYHIVEYKQNHDSQSSFMLFLEHGRSYERDSSRDFSTNSLEMIREWADRIDEIVIESILWRLYSNGEEYDQAEELLGRELTKDEIEVVGNLVHEFKDLYAEVVKHKDWERYLEDGNHHHFDGDYGIKEKMNIMNDFFRFRSVGDNSEQESDYQPDDESDD